jgi:hypothetical protein
MSTSADFLFFSFLLFFGHRQSNCAYTILHSPSQLSMLDIHARASMLLHFTSSPTAFDRVDETRILGMKADVANNSFYQYPKSPAAPTAATTTATTARPLPPLHSSSVRSLSMHSSDRTTTDMH